MVTLSKKIKVGIALLIVLVVVVLILVAIFSFFLLLLPIAIILFLIGYFFRYLRKIKKQVSPTSDSPSAHPRIKPENKEVIDVDYKVK